MAAAAKLTVTVVAGPPGLSVPLVAETLSHDDVFTRLQLNEPPALLVKEYAGGAGLNGPPTGPLMIMLPPGVICKGSRIARAVMRLLPVGVPQPVQRS